VSPMCLLKGLEDTTDKAWKDVNRIKEPEKCIYRTKEPEKCVYIDLKNQRNVYIAWLLNEHC